MIFMALSLISSIACVSEIGEYIRTRHAVHMFSAGFLISGAAFMAAMAVS